MPRRSRKIGAPPTRDPRPRERFQLGVRVTPEIKSKLETAARDSGRSINQETELRIERSFVVGDLLSEALSVAFGERLAGILFVLGTAMIDQGRRITDRTDRRVDWTADSMAYDAAVFAAVRLLEYGRPDGNRASDSDRNVAAQWVDELIEELNGDRADEILGPWRVASINRLTGPIVTRMGAALRQARGSRASSRKMREVR
jgi:hypothetical protein